MSLTTQLNLTLAAAQTITHDTGDARANYREVISESLASGTGDNEADVIFADTRTIAASGSESLDLAGSLTGPLAGSVVFAKVKAILVVADAGNTNNVLLGDAASPIVGGPFGDGTQVIPVLPGDCFLWTAKKAGIAVTPTTADLLKVANSSGTTGVTYTIVIIGTSA